eukprot:gb/GECG01011889.1/.p1 GENE.gb/GECG01011889.1/~~gb/GECG01011889.1/.p1  ORF type:complete len:211 (+),score=27.35 gb/GECG01011889.1/:1-633(+)
MTSKLPKTKATAELLKIQESLGDNSGVKTDEIETLIQRPKVGCAAICISDLQPGRLLVGRRQGSHGEGTYALPGGHLEAGETWATCVLRELEEETGISTEDVKNCSPTRVSIAGRPLDAPPADVKALYATVTNDWMEAESLHYITIFMLVHLKNTALVHLKNTAQVDNKEPEKCEGWSWVTPEELKKVPVVHSSAAPAGAKCGNPYLRYH